MFRIFTALAFLGAFSSAFASVRIECKNKTVSFDEGIDDYILSFQLLNTPASLGAALASDPSVSGVTVQVRMPKLLREPVLTPGCFLADERPLLFTCPSRAPSENIQVFENDGLNSGSVREFAFEKFAMQAKLVSRVGPNAFKRYEWGFEASFKDKAFKGLFIFNEAECGKGEK